MRFKAAKVIAGAFQIIFKGAPCGQMGRDDVFRSERERDPVVCSE